MKKNYGESDTQVAERYISACRQAAAIFPALRRTIIKFDAKIYNKRFLSTLQEECGGIHIFNNLRKNANSQTIEIGFFPKEPNGKHGDALSILWFNLPANKRINAAEMVQAAADKRAEYLKAADHMMQVLPTIETRRQQIEILRKQLEAVTADLTYIERDIFDLHYRFGRW